MNKFYTQFVEEKLIYSPGSSLTFTEIFEAYEKFIVEKKLPILADAERDIENLNKIISAKFQRATKLSRVFYYLWGDIEFRGIPQ